MSTSQGEPATLALLVVDLVCWGGFMACLAWHLAHHCSGYLCTFLEYRVKGFLMRSGVNVWLGRVSLCGFLATCSFYSG